MSTSTHERLKAEGLVDAVPWRIRPSAPHFLALLDAKQLLQTPFKSPKMGLDVY